MKLYTVTALFYCDHAIDEVAPFSRVFRSLEAARENIVMHLREMCEAYGDDEQTPLMQVTFESDTFATTSPNCDDTDRIEWMIEEVEIADDDNVCPEGKRSDEKCDCVLHQMVKGDENRKVTMRNDDPGQRPSEKLYSSEMWLVSADHSHDDYRFIDTPVRLYLSSDGYSSTHPKLGCSKTFRDGFDAIRALFHDHACYNVRIRKA